MTARSVKDWFEFVQENDDDKVAKELLDTLTSYSGQYHGDIQKVVAMITAIRLDQMTKEVRSENS